MTDRGAHSQARHSAGILIPGRNALRAADAFLAPLGSKQGDEAVTEEKEDAS